MMTDIDGERNDIPDPCWIKTLRKRWKELEESGFLEEVSHRDQGHSMEDGDQ